MKVDVFWDHNNPASFLSFCIYFFRVGLICNTNVDADILLEVAYVQPYQKLNILIMVDFR